MKTKVIISLIQAIFLVSMNAAGQKIDNAIWVKDANASEKDYHVAFRGTLSLEKEEVVDLKLLASSWFVVWVNGEYYTEGPARYHVSYPEYQTHKLRLSKGKNVIAIQVHQEGVSSRMLKDIAPFLWCEASTGQTPVFVDWKARRLDGYLSGFFRISAQFGWVEWVDTRLVEQDWNQSGFDDSRWEVPHVLAPAVGEAKALTIENVQHFQFTPKVIAKGQFTERYGYERDNISARFFLRDLQANDNPPQGVWVRYDLERVRLMRPKFVLDLPAGAVVEFAYCEELIDGRVSPWITLSGSDSYNMDHFVARGGRQEFFPLTPKGGRFVEMHIIAPPGQAKIVNEQFIERGYYGNLDGSFQSDDALLNTIWNVGVDTYKACSEDAVIDNPTRERGQWTGDVGVVGLEIGSSAFSDVKLIRRGLVQSAQCAQANGMVAGLCPGGEAYLSSYALQWVSGCLNYWRVTGDKTVLTELFAAAQKNMDAMFASTTSDGLLDKAGWAFIDWGYVRNDGPVDIGLNLHYLASLRDMIQWCRILGKKSQLALYESKEKEIHTIVGNWYNSMLKDGHYDFVKIGYHRTVLGLISHYFSQDSEKEAIQYIKNHILSCFPNNPDAPRLSDPGNSNSQLITPYFSHYVLPLLIEKGEMDFVLDQYRKCWGWALGGGRTTWVEVFDTRWTHCHQWAGCPTWQLTRYVLGLKNRFDLASNTFDLCFVPGSLNRAEGRIPITGTDKSISVKWERQGNAIRYMMETDIPITVNIPRNGRFSKSGAIKVKDKLELHVKLK